MDTKILEKYAALLVHYCVELKPKDKLYISTTILAEPLVRAIYAEATKLGAVVEVDFKFRDQNKIFYENCLLYTSPSPRDRQKSRMPSSA